MTSEDWNLRERQRKSFPRIWLCYVLVICAILCICNIAIAEDVYTVDGNKIKVEKNGYSRICNLDGSSIYAVESYDKSAVMISPRGYVEKNRLDACSESEVLHVSLIPDRVGFLSDINISKGVYVALDFVSVAPMMYLATVARIGTERNLVSIRGSYVSGGKASVLKRDAFVSSGEPGSSIISRDGRFVAPDGKMDCSKDAYPGVWEIFKNRRVVTDDRSCSVLFSSRKVN